MREEGKVARPAATNGQAASLKRPAHLAPCYKHSRTPEPEIDSEVGYTAGQSD